MTYAQWNPQQNYLINDIVYDGVQLYEAATSNTGKQPSLNTPSVWVQYSTIPVTRCGQWYLNQPQTVDTYGLNQETPINFQLPEGWADLSIIPDFGPDKSLFTVVRQGVYSFQLTVQLTQVGGYGTSSPLRALTLSLERDGNAAPVFQYDWNETGLPSTYSQSLSGVIECLPGDILQWKMTDSLSAGSYTINPPSTAPTEWQFNTFWSWTLIKSTP